MDTTLHTSSGDALPGTAGTARRVWLGEFLRAKRERLRPTDFGLQGVGRRRTPGLRREEVAMLAHVGVTWYTWLEQGRDITVSSRVLDAIAAALRLDGQEREHFYLLAGQAAPEQTPATQRITRLLGRLLGATTELPAYLTDRYWNTIEVNRLGRSIFGLEPSSNCLVTFFTNEEYSTRYLYRETAAAMMVAQFRQRAAAYPQDAHFESIASELGQRSPEFAAIWAEHRVSQEPHVEVAYEHPELGLLKFDSVALSPAGAEDVVLFVYIPDSDTAERLRDAPSGDPRG